MPATHVMILEELRAHLGTWYPDLAGDVQTNLTDLDPRVRSQLMRVRVTGRGGPDRTIIIKHPPDEPVIPDDRPRLVAPTDPARRLTQEFESLRLVYERFGAGQDPSLGAVRPLGILPETHALAMEAYDGRPLQDTLIPGFIRQSSELGAPRVVRRAGHWLRAFHDTDPGDRPTRQGSRAEVAAAFEAVGRYLAAHGAPSDVGDIVEVGVRAVSRLPEPPPVAVVHGDFAPRNILISATGRVAVIDIGMRMLAPVYEDLAAFLVAMRMSRANALTRGYLFGPAVDRLEPAFLDGYFGGAPIPRAAIRVYELLLVLDKWSARLSRSSEQSGIRRLADRAIDHHFAATSRLLARRLTPLR